MQYRKLLITGMALLLTYGAEAQIQEKVKIEAATVFLQGAELTSTAKVNLPAGESEVVFTNIAGNLDNNSINVATDKKIAILSATFKKDYLNPKLESGRVKILKDSIENVKDQQNIIAAKLDVVQTEINILKTNNTVAGANTGLSVVELEKLIALVNAKMENFLKEDQRLVKQNDKLNELLNDLNNQLSVEQQKNQSPGGQLLVKFYSSSPVSSGVTITYVTRNAGWVPLYDLRITQLDKPITLSYKANLLQNSGISWDDVKLTLSTGNPTEGGQAPALTPWNLHFYIPSPRSETAIRAYKVPLIDKYAGQGNIMTGNDIAAAPANAGIVSAVDNAGINTSFDIDIPYSIPSDGQYHILTMKTYELPATYRYYAVPKLDKDAFLQAQATNWEDLNLLPGQANIFYDGAFVGESTIDTRNVKDTMTFSLGRDKKIIVKREQDKKLHAVKMIGSNQRESFSYTISVRNTRKQAIDLVVADQVPVSNDKDIVIEDVDTDGGSQDEATGQVKWIMHLEANETKTVKLSYTVKYPKGKIVDNLR